jgi:hypothetical protein
VRASRFLEDLGTDFAMTCLGREAIQEPTVAKIAVVMRRGLFSFSNLGKPVDIKEDICYIRGYLRRRLLLLLLLRALQSMMNLDFFYYCSPLVPIL